MENKVKVSICCVTYNHENFISDAIESFLMQRTFFPYEILIHDDASTDRTPLIIREYESLYPGIIRGVYQTVNQYSRGERVSRFLLEKAKGSYVAVCEGDDYWTDPDKLQKQVDYMEDHPGCSLCVHGAIHVGVDNRSLASKTRPARRSRRFAAEEVIEGGGGLFPTNSFLYPVQYAVERPDYYKNAPVGDYPLAIYLATQGYVYYMDRMMSTYRVGVEGSWSVETLCSKEKLKDHFEKINVMLEAVNRETEHRYEESILNTIKNNQFRLLLIDGKKRELRSRTYRDCYRNLPRNTKTRMFLQKYCPVAVGIIKKTKEKWFL